MGFNDAGGPLGTVKLTLQKFYRINGGSTQLRGVSSDIVLPDLYEHYKIREKDQPDALPWDEMPKADYTTWKYAYDINNIRNASTERTNTQYFVQHNFKGMRLGLISKMIKESFESESLPGRTEK